MAEMPKKPSAGRSADAWSAGLAALTSVGLIIWVVATHYRIGYQPEGGGNLLLPNWFPVTETPLWAALVVLGLQMFFLSASAVSASTRREELGIMDMSVSIAALVVVVALDVLVAAGYARASGNLWNGLAAFTWVSLTETLATIRVWQVANRRPGGVIAA